MEWVQHFHENVCALSEAKGMYKTMNQKTSALSGFAVLAIAFITMGVGTVTPALNVIFGAFPQESLTTLLLVSTLPSLTVIPATLIAGSLAGNKVKYKNLAIVGILLFIIGGVAPYFASDWTVVLIERAVFGIGLGIISPLPNALAMGLYEGDKVASMMGMITLLMNIGGMFLQFLGGFCAGFGWNFAFLPHALGILSLLAVIFFLPEPPKQNASIEAGKVITKEKIPGKLWLVAGVFGFSVMLIYPLLVNMSSLLEAGNLGDSTTAGIVLAFYTIGGMAAGALFGQIFKATKKYILSIGLFAAAIGIAMVLFGGNVVLVTIGTALAGFAFSIGMPAVFMIVSMIVKPSQQALATSIILAAMNLFAFLSTYWIAITTSITGDALKGPILAGMVILAVLGILFIFLNPMSAIVAPKEKIN